MASTTEITLEQLASVDANLLFKALEMRLSASGVIKKRGGKKAAAKASSASGDDDAASQTSRSVGEGTKRWNALTASVAALVKEALAGEKGGPGFHLKALSYLKTEKSLAADTVPSLEQVSEAVAFLKSNPDWTSPNQKTKAAKAEAKPTESSAAASSAGPKIVVKKPEAPAAEPKKKGRPAKSEEEKAAEKAAKEAEKAAKKAAEKAEKEAKKAAEKAEKKSAKKPASAAKKAEPESEAEAEETEFSEIELDGVSYFWDTESGAVFENIDGHPGEKIGTWNGSDNEITKTE